MRSSPSTAPSSRPTSSSPPPTSPPPCASSTSTSCTTPARWPAVSTPRTWYPKGEDEARALAASSELPRPLLLKPRMQVQLASGSKGGRVDEGDDFVAKYTEYVRSNTFGAALVADDPDVVWPMVQEFLEAATHDIYSLSGFADGDRFVVRAAVKVLQRPRKLGIGAVLRERPGRRAPGRVAGALVQAGRLPRRVRGGVRRSARCSSTSTPRPYSQMAFESGARHAAALALVPAGRRRTRPRSPPRWSERSPGTIRAATSTPTASSSASSPPASSSPAPSAARPTSTGRAGNTSTAAATPTPCKTPTIPCPLSSTSPSHARNFFQHPRSFLRSLSR